MTRLHKVNISASVEAAAPNAEQPGSPVGAFKAFDFNGADSSCHITAFLETCKQSSGQAYANFKGLLTRLEDPATRSQARVFLADVQRHLAAADPDGDHHLTTYHFRIHDLTLCEAGWEESVGRQKMTLLELPSIFIPEEWSFTFFEGLSRYPQSEFHDRDVVELGCGNGWISLALAGRWLPRKIIGLDINPRAIRCAQVNLYLNAVDPDGNLHIDSEGKSLLDRVEFHVSDLLQHCLERNILVDRIVGCIPQILSPDPGAMAKIVSENESEEFLYSLSNYCSLQGLVEDQFGLGLIARALEESIQVVKPSGAIIMNMGGRPGQAVLERLYRRRGFHIRKVWQTRVGQAADTDILALVKIESSSRHRFEFFMGPVGVDEPISARTAWGFAHAGGKIFHGLTVYEARLAQPNQVKAIFRFLMQPGYAETRSALDLAFGSESVADEKTAFLAHLAGSLSRLDSFPYDHVAGNPGFREALATFLRLYYRVSLDADNVLVQPSRCVLLETVLTMYSPRLALVDSGLTRNLPRKWLTSLPPVGPSKGDTSDGAGLRAAIAEGSNFQTGGADGAGPPSSPEVVVLESPTRADLVLKLVRALKPQVVVVGMASFELRTATAFEQLLDATKEVGARLFVDLSEYLELSSLPSVNGVLTYMAEQKLPQHAAVFSGLVKNQVYQDLEVCFTISENSTLLSALKAAGELVYQRTPILAQHYYHCLLRELLAFQIPDRRALEPRPPRPEDGDMASRFVGLTAAASKAFSHPAAQRVTRKDGPDDVNMDYGENLLPAPTSLRQFVYEAFARQNLTDAETDPAPEVLALLRNQFGLQPSKSTEVVFGDGVASLLAKLIAACAEEGGTLFYPSGTYGAFVATADFYGTLSHRILTGADRQFKLTPAALEAALKEHPAKRSWLSLTVPTVNPTGVVYSHGEIAALLEVARWHGLRVILDVAFAGLEFGLPVAEPAAAPHSLDPSLAPPNQAGEESSYAVAIVGGIEKEFSAGGLQFGFAVVRDAVFLDALKGSCMSKPHLTLRYAVKRLLSQRLDGAEPMAGELAEQRLTLKKRAKALASTLQGCGWEPLLPQGGLFLVATPAAYLGRSVTHTAADQSQQSITITRDNIDEALYQTTGLIINGSQWTGIPGYCRFVYSTTEETFQRGLECLRRFQQLVLSKHEQPPASEADKKKRRKG